MANEYKSIYTGQEVDEAVSTAQKALTTDNIVQTTGPSQSNVMSQAAVTAALQNIQTSGTVVISNGVQQETWDADTKINVFQGTTNAGKTLIVGQDGNVVLQTVQTTGTIVQVNGVPQTTIDFTSNPQTQLNDILQEVENNGSEIQTLQTDIEELGNTVNEISGEINNKQNIPIVNNYTIQSSSWMALENQSPYTYNSNINISPTVGVNSIIELINNQPVLFAKYGFAIGEINGQSVIIYSIGQPSNDTTLTLSVIV